ncbi:MAG: CDP-alcohol phosphatidyltransferase family protein [Amaricoccus sp.]|uniref:CDP-alcohol phosphatidyltransferase family protein n=1 Tax=Amaricoccus sp. TaxID=1872485 RepID=UPI00331643DA
MALALLLWAAPLTPAARLLGLAAFALVVWVVQVRIAAHHPFDRFGLANGITLVRAAGVGALLAFAASPPADAGTAWSVLGLSAGLIALDGLDGWAARRQGLASGFGARFDMEVDALAILALAWLAVGLGKAGPWVLGLGLMRYAFLLAGLLAPRLSAPLPPSPRRKAVCVLQLLVLTALLAPPLTPPVSGDLALLAFGALAWSFATDLRWLAGRP